jgi:predicted O-methyltransferase YrrM
MKHFYQNEQFEENWFSFASIYKDFVSIMKDDSIFVEVGSWKGRSAAYMAVEIINSNKNINFYCVDTWKGSAEHSLDSNVENDTLYELFLSNIDPVKHIIKPLRMSSIDASKLFENNTIDIAFIDADHTYESVKKDIESWKSKIKQGGILAGHDYHDSWPGVKKAVNESFVDQKIYTLLDCWMVQI